MIFPLEFCQRCLLISGKKKKKNHSRVGGSSLRMCYRERGATWPGLSHVAQTVSFKPLPAPSVSISPPTVLSCCYETSSCVSVTCVSLEDGHGQALSRHPTSYPRTSSALASTLFLSLARMALPGGHPPAAPGPGWGGLGEDHLPPSSGLAPSATQDGVTGPWDRAAAPAPFISHQEPLC